MAMEAWRPLRLIAQDIPGAEIRVVDKEILLPGGGLVQVRSADDPQKLRGAGLDFVVVDEARFVRNLRDVWEQALRPSLSDRLGGAMFISTPKGINDDFHWLWTEAHTREGWEAFQFPTSANPYIDAGEIEAARQDLGGLVFSQEYLAEFVELGGTVFKSEWIRYADQDTVGDDVVWSSGGRSVKQSLATRFCTVDLAASIKEHADYTVIAACASLGGILVVLEVVRKRLEAPDIVPEIRRVMEKHRLGVGHVESAGFQLAIVQEARRQGLAVKELRADRDKLARALPLAARMEAGDVWLVRGDWLKDLEPELLGFPGARHDDQVDALSYAAALVGRSPAVLDLGVLGDVGARISPNRP